MKCANRGLFVCLQEGGQGKENGTTRLFWQFHFFPNVLEWGIIMKYGLERGKLLHFVVFILVWVVKKKRSDCSKHGSLQFLDLSLILTRLLSVWERKNRFSHFSLPCIPLNLQCKFDKHTTSCLAGVFLVCIYFIGDADWDGVVLWSSNIAADNTDAQEKKQRVFKRSASILLLSSSKCLQDFRITSFTTTNVLYVSRAVCVGYINVCNVFDFFEGCFAQENKVPFSDNKIQVKKVFCQIFANILNIFWPYLPVNMAAKDKHMITMHQKWTEKPDELI